MYLTLWHHEFSYISKNIVISDGGDTDNDGVETLTLTDDDQSAGDLAEEVNNELNTEGKK